MELNTQFLVDRLVQRMDLDRIFLFQFLDEGRKSPHLLLVVNPIKGVSIRSVAPIIHLCMADMPEIPFTVIWTSDWVSQLKKGSLYYTYASLPSHQLYQSGKKGYPTVSNKLVNSLLEMFVLDYAQGKKVSDEFMVACYSFRSKMDFFQATAMLHQFVMLRLKGFQSMVGVAVGKSQNLEHILKVLRGAVPGLFEIFTYDVHSTRLLRLLDSSYLYSKKKDRIDILEAEFEFLLVHCQALGKAMDDMVDFMNDGVATYRQKQNDRVAQAVQDGGSVDEISVVVDPKHSKTIVAGPPIREDFSGFPWLQKYKDDANIVLDRIYSSYRPEQILLVNYHMGVLSKGNPFEAEAVDQSDGVKIQLYLVVLTKKNLPFSFRQRNFGDVGACMIFLDLPYVEKHLALGSRFVNIVWKKSWILRQKSTFHVQLMPREIDWSCKLERIKLCSENARSVMQNLLMTMTGAPLLMPDTALLLLRELYSIGIQTYLQCAVGFIPKDMDLSALLDWSAIASTDVLDGILNTHDLNKLILSIILKPQDIWWKSAAMDMDEKHKTLVISQARSAVELYERLFEGLILSIEQRIAQVS